MIRHFRILDTVASLSGPSEIIGPIVAAYERFGFESSGPGQGVRVAVRSGDPPTLEADGRVVPLLPELDATLQVYQRFLEAVLDGFTSHAVLHAAALITPGGDAVLLAAPAGHGKTTLTLELVSRGFGFLSDDYAPLDPSSSAVSPYPRRVGLRLEDTEHYPERIRRAAADPAAPRLFGKALLDVGGVLGEAMLATRPAPLRHVVLLTSRDPEAESPDSTTWLRLAARREASARISAALEEIDGVEIAEGQELSEIVLWQVRLHHERMPTEALSRVLEDEAIIVTEKYWEDRPDFSATPAKAPIKRRIASTLLGREMLNRRGNSRFPQRYDGSVTRMLLDLAEALRGAACWRVRVGRYRETADLIEELVEKGA